MTIHRLGELENVIGQVAASYEAGRLIDSLSSAQLPNKRQVIESLGHLKGVMYLGYYATGTLDESKLRFAIASHLYPAYEILVEQIRRAASYEGFRSAAPREYLVNEWDYGGYEREVDVPPGYGSGLEASLANGQLVIRVLRGDAVDGLTAQPTGA